MTTPAADLRVAAERVRDEPYLVGGKAVAEPLAELFECCADWDPRGGRATTRRALDQADAILPTPSPSGSNPGGGQ